MGLTRYCAARSASACCPIAYVSSAASTSPSDSTAVTNAATSVIAVSAASQFWLTCCERYQPRIGYERCVSISSAAHASQSRRSRSSSSHRSRPAPRRRITPAAGGGPAPRPRSQLRDGDLPSREGAVHGGQVADHDEEDADRDRGLEEGDHVDGCRARRPLGAQEQAGAEEQAVAEASPDRRPLQKGEPDD